MKNMLRKTLTLACLTAALTSATALAAEPTTNMTKNNASMQQEASTVQSDRGVVHPQQKDMKENQANISKHAQMQNEMKKINQNLIYTQGQLSVKATVESLEADLKKRNIPVFAKFDHAMNAQKVGLNLRPTTVVVFGAPKVGTGLMQLDQSVSIELPLRISVWEDADGHTWIAYPNLTTQMAAYDLQNNPIVGKMSILLADLVHKAAKK